MTVVVQAKRILASVVASSVAALALGVSQADADPGVVAAAAPVAPSSSRALTQSEGRACAERHSSISTAVASHPPVPKRTPGEAPWSPIAASGSGPSSAPCSPPEYAALAGVEFAEAVATSRVACLGSLWSFDGDVAAALVAPNIVAVADSIATDAADLSLNATRLARSALLYQIAFFHEFYQSALTYDAATFAAAQAAMTVIGDDSALVAGDAGIDQLRGQWIISVDSTNASHLNLGAIRGLLERYADDPALAASYDERNIAFYASFTIARQIGNAYNLLGDQSPWYDLVDPGLIAALAEVGLDLSFTEDTAHVVENALFALAHMSYLEPETAAAAHDVVSTAYDIFPQYSGPWFRALVDLDFFFGAELADGSTLDVAAIRADVEGFALPHEYVFDQGRLVFKTAIDLATAEQLYDAIQEVESQFFRATTYIDPVPGDP
ncbi:MAG: M9 family metallopeptidase N-terminal domain-containing protein, partial [Pseudomonadales bacterium]|nr:M9 family metallopeptidase N-terminal domain-containing protein [Pseudomonadales bacterium]